MDSIGIVFLAFGGALLLTLIMELTVAVVFGVRTVHGLLVVVFVNTLTNPLVNLYNVFMYDIFRDVPMYYYIIPAEIVVIIVEALIYRGFDRHSDVHFRHPVGMAAAANIISWGTGEILRLIR